MTPKRMWQVTTQVTKQVTAMGDRNVAIKF
jgi:hypothetical protein